jgi:hypothetical protein
VDRNGGPPTQEDTESYIVVTDVDGKGLTYFEGFVNVGGLYSLDAGGVEFEGDQLITIYSSNETNDFGNVLQQVQFRADCSTPLELANRFGASQLVGFFNEEQGEVSRFVTYSLEVDVEIPIEIRGPNVTLENLTVVTNFAGELDLSDQVAGALAPPGGTVTVTLGGTVDFSERLEYTFSATVTGTHASTGELCAGTDVLSFFAGGLAGGPTVPPEPERLLRESPSLD